MDGSPRRSTSAAKASATATNRRPPWRGVEGGDAPGVGLDLGDLLRSESPQAGHSVGLAAPLELFEAASSDSSVATTSLPERWWGMSRSSQ